MATTTKTNSRPRAVLKLPEYEVPKLLVRARSYVLALTNNPRFPSPHPSLATVLAAIEALSDAQRDTLSRTAGTVALRDEKRQKLVFLLQELLGHVQATADADPENAASIIESAGMALKRLRTLPPRAFKVQQGRVSGSAKLLAPKAAPRAAYEWAYSTDGGRTWTGLPITVQANTTVYGMTPGTVGLFRYRTATKDGVGDWSDAVSLVVT
jgi:hypothetical protein